MRSIPKVPKTIVAAVWVSWALASTVAGAEAARSAKADALARLQDGNAYLGQGRATDALTKFTEAYQLFPSPKLHYNIGQAHSLIPGHEAQAYESMFRFLTEAADANPELRAAAETQRQQLRPKVGLVSVTAEPADADLELDGVNLGTVTRGLPTVMGIGTHRLALKKGDAASSPRTITIAGGEMLDVTLRLAGALPVALATPPVEPPAVGPFAGNPADAPRPADVVQIARETPTGGYWTWQHELGAGLVGLAAVSLAVGVIEHIRYFGKKDDFVNAGCGTDGAFLSAHPSCQTLDNQFKSANTWWVVGYVGAAVLGGTGAFLLWPSPVDSKGMGAGSVASVSSGMMVNFEARF